MPKDITTHYPGSNYLQYVFCAVEDMLVKHQAQAMIKQLSAQQDIIALLDQHHDIKIYARQDIIVLKDPLTTSRVMEENIALGKEIQLQLVHVLRDFIVHQGPQQAKQMNVHKEVIALSDLQPRHHVQLEHMGQAQAQQNQEIVSVVKWDNIVEALE